MNVWLEFFEGVRFNGANHVFRRCATSLGLIKLCRLLDQFLRTDWAALTDRIHFIADMFRCYQTTPALFDPPFTADQVIALKAGQVPIGRL